MVIGDKWVDLSTVQVMGIVNVTPDSFYDGSRSESTADILSTVKDMLKCGASIIDVGGYSSRPSAADISVKEEIDRIVPAIQAIKSHFPEAIISLDTFRSEVAKAGLDAGADLINDISGFSIDPKLIKVVADYGVPYILMHMKGTPQTMQNETEYDNLFKEIYCYFSEKIAVLESAGVKDIIIDLGFGFAKTVEQNHTLLNEMQHFQTLEKPMLLGVSRKSMIYKKLGTTPEEALNGTIALNAIGISKGANILRVHDVKEAVELVKLLEVRG
ncbi:MAG: dihydropteroate synthase [Crocinitomicaceae bacterium]|nr:dihydropteroate synthase [Crocinitomicaceae bacterium]